MKKKVFFIVGTRPEVIKVFPVYLAFQQDPGYDVKLISSGQQKEMSTQMLDFFQMNLFADLQIMKANQDLADITLSLLSKLDKLMDEEKPDLVFVQGDTSTAFIGGLAAFYRKVPVAHIEAGLRSDNIYSPYPEEANRLMLSSIATLHFAPTQTALNYLKQERKVNIHLTGNTVVDCLMHITRRIDKSKENYQSRFPYLAGQPYLVLVTLHRRELQGEKLERVLGALRDIALDSPDYLFVYPVHYNPKVRKPVQKMLSNVPGIVLEDPLPYDQLIYLVRQSRLIITDSGGIQEEAPTFEKPVMVIRDTTERIESIDAGIAWLTGYEPDVMKRVFDFLKDKDNYRSVINKMVNPYGDGLAAERIKKITDDYFQ